MRSGAIKTRVRKWGNSLAIRIPKSLADKANLKNGSRVTLNATDGYILVTPIAESQYNLDDLLAQVTEDNLHQEFCTDSGLPD